MSNPNAKGGQRQRSKAHQQRNPSCVMGCGAPDEKTKYGFVLCVGCQTKIELINQDAKEVRRAVIRAKYPPIPVP